MDFQVTLYELGGLYTIESIPVYYIHMIIYNGLILKVNEKVTQWILISWLYQRPGHEVIKLFSSSTQLSTTVQLLIKTKIPTNEVSCISLSDVVFIMLVSVKMPTIHNCWHFNIYKQDKFRAQLS